MSGKLDNYKGTVNALVSWSCQLHDATSNLAGYGTLLESRSIDPLGNAPNRGAMLRAERYGAWISWTMPLYSRMMQVAISFRSVIPTTWVPTWSTTNLAAIPPEPIPKGM